MSSTKIKVRDRFARSQSASVLGCILTQEARLYLFRSFSLFPYFFLDNYTLENPCLVRASIAVSKRFASKYRAIREMPGSILSESTSITKDAEVGDERGTHPHDSKGSRTRQMVICRYTSREH